MASRLHTLITDFTSGELSPRWQARVAGGQIPTPHSTTMSLASVYQSGCEELTNMVVLPQGGVAYRQGTEFLQYADDDFASVVNEGDDYRLVTFRVGASDLYTVWRPNEVQVYAADGTPGQTLATPYTQSDLAGLAFTQTQLEMIILSAEYRPRVLRAEGFVFVFEDTVNRLAPPQYAFSDGADNVPVVIERDFTLELSPFTPKQRDIFVEVSRNGNVMKAIAKSADDSTTASQLETALRSTAVVKNDTIQVNITGTNTFQITYEYWGSVGDGTGDLQVTTPERDPTKLDIDVTDNLAAAGGTPQAQTEPLWSGPFHVFTGGNYYKCIKSHRSDATNQPGVGASWTDFWEDAGATLPPGDIDLDTSWVANRAYFPRDRGWPSLGTFHEQRLILNGPPGVTHALAAGTITQTEYLDFTLGPNPSDGILLLVANERALSIQWFLSQRRLFIGTTQGLYIQTAIPFTPTSFSLERHSVTPAARIRALPVSGEIFYADVNLRRQRKVQYVNDVDHWEGKDVALFAEHFFTESNKVKDWAYQSGTDSVVWVVRDDGALFSMTYDANYVVQGWAKHNVGAPVLRVETLYDDNREIIVLLVKRTFWDTVTGSFQVRPTVEAIAATSNNNYVVSPNFATGDITADPVPGENWSVHQDSYELVAGNGTNVLSVPRFANQTVSVVENGVYHGKFPVAADGTLTLTEDTIVLSRIAVGYQYTGRVRPNRIQFADADGVTQSQKIRWTKPLLRLFASTMPRINGERPREKAQTDNYDTHNALHTGDVDIVNLGSDTGLTIEVDQPLPCVITGIFGLLTTEGG